MKITKIIQAKNVFLLLTQDKADTQGNTSVQRLPFALGRKLFKFCKAAEVEEEFYRKKWNEAVAEFAEADEKGKVLTNENGSIKYKEGKTEADLNKILTEINNFEVDDFNFSFTEKELSVLDLSIREQAIIDDFIIEDGVKG